MFCVKILPLSRSHARKGTRRPYERRGSWFRRGGGGEEEGGEWGLTSNSLLRLQVVPQGQPVIRVVVNKISLHVDEIGTRTNHSCLIRSLDKVARSTRRQSRL